MSATMSDASHSASGATDCRLMVQLPLLVRGMLTMSNCTLRHSGCRSRAEETRALFSWRVAGVVAKSVSKSMSHPFNRGFWVSSAAGATNGLRYDFRAGLVNAALRRGTFDTLARRARADGR